MPNKPRFTYANVTSTIAFFLALSGGVAWAAGKIHSGNIANNAVRTAKIAPEAVKAGKIAKGAVVTNRIANGAVGSAQIADGAVGSQQIANGSITVSDLKDPVGFVASPTGGSSPLTDRTDFVYPLTDNTWTQPSGEFDVVFGQIQATLAAASGSEPCEVEINIMLNGQEMGGQNFSSSSTSPEQVTRELGGQPSLNFEGPTPKKLTMTVSAGGCAAPSAIQSTQMRVLGIG
jgi:hypothetical protein